MAVKLTPQEAREKHARNLKASSQDMVAGVRRVTTAPGVQAAAAVDKMRQNLVAKIDDGTWARRVSSVSLSDWQDRMINVGVGRVAAGIDAAAPKMEEFFTSLFAHQDRLIDQVGTMPDLTLQDSINRAVTWITGMAEFKR